MAEGKDDDPRAWIHDDESAKAMLARVLAERPLLLLLPPLHRVPLRVGNVVEIAGPSASAKSQVLLQAAVHSILPKEWNGVPFGGLERIVVYFDLDCRFDVLRLCQILRHRIAEVLGSKNTYSWGSHQGPQEHGTYDAVSFFDDELIFSCMRRFLYVRCYSSSEFVAALKEMHLRMLNESEALGVGIQFLMIDSIGAFYWIDRGNCTKMHLSFQDLTGTIVHEMRKLLDVQHILVLATKSSIFGAGYSPCDAQREAEKLSYQEYMPSVWQAFVTHRIHLQASDKFVSDTDNYTFPLYTSEWVQPPLNIKDRFAVRDEGIILVP